MDDKKEDVIKEVIADKPNNKSTIIQIAFLIILLIAIMALINATITIYKYKDMLSNPIGYNLDKFNLNYCTCYNDEGSEVLIKSLSFNDSSVLPTNSKINFSFLN
jgi:hypothetical protein